MNTVISKDLILQQCHIQLMGKQGSVEEITLKPFSFSHPRKESERTITKKKSSSKGQLSKINTKFLSETKPRAGLSLCSAGINSNLISAPCSLTQLSKGRRHGAHQRLFRIQSGTDLHLTKIMSELFILKQPHIRDGGRAGVIRQ